MNNAVATTEQVPVSKVQEVATKIVKLKAILDANKPLYEELDKLTLELKNLIGDDGLVTVKLNAEDQVFVHNGLAMFIAETNVVTVVDNFKASNTVFRPAGVKRFETQVKTAAEYQKDLEKKAKKNAAK